MPDVMEQALTVEASPSVDAALSGEQAPSQPGGLASPDIGGTAAQPASPDGGATADKPGQDQTPVETEKDWKLEYERAQAEITRRDQAYRLKESQRRSEQNRAAALQQQLDAVKQARAERVQAILADESKQIEIAADPAARQAFISEIVQFEMDKRDAVQQQQQAQFQQMIMQRQWDQATVSLMQWACLNEEEGPKLTEPEWQDWIAKNSRMYTANTFETPEDAIDAAKNQLRGQYLPKISARMRAAAEKDAALKAKQTLAHSAPPGAASVNIGTKGKSPGEVWLESMESPGIRTISELFK